MLVRFLLRWPRCWPFAVSLPASQDRDQGRGDLLDPGRPRGRGRRRQGRRSRSLVGPDIDAHTYQPRPGRRARAGRSAGAGEQRPGLRGLDRPSRQGRALQGPRDRGVDRRRDPDRRDGARHHGHTHAHGPDPHCWQDVARVRRYVANIAQGLADGRSGRTPRTIASAPQSYDTQPGRARRLGEGRDRQGAGRQAQGDHRPRLVPLFLAVPMACSSMSPRGYNTSSEPSATRRRGADPRGARAEASRRCSSRT